MTVSIAPKFDADNDSSRPKIGDEIEIGRVKHKIMKVDWTDSDSIFKEVFIKRSDSVLMARGEFDACHFRDHPVNRDVKWLIWSNRVK